MSENKVARHREEFLQSGAAPADVRDEVAMSWLRCSSWSVRPEAVEPPFQPEVNRESRLVRAARPVLDGVNDRLGDLEISFLVSDTDGLIVDRRVQEHSLLSRLDRFNISPGHLFAEDAVGTNGIGTALETGKLTRIDGHEHYWDVFVNFTCVGVPIMDPLRRKPLGVLDVTCAAVTANSLLDLIAEQTARAIEARLLELHSALERELLDQFMLANRRTRGGLVVLSDRVMIANPQASRLFSMMDHPLIWDHAARATSVGNAIEASLSLPDGRTVGTRTTALRAGGEVIGSLMEIKSIGEGQEPSRPRTPRRRMTPALPTGIAGQDPALLQAYSTARAAIADQTVVICGEPGVGKATLARWALPSDAIRIDCSEVQMDGEASWLATVGSRLASRPRGVLVLRADLLSVEATRQLLPLLTLCTARGSQCVVTFTCGVWSRTTILPELDAERVWVPPLRNRLADLPLLVAARAGAIRVSSEVIQLFMRLTWPGNVRELFRVVDEMISGAASGSLTTADVPANVRAAAPRRPLSRFEQAEIHAVLDSLAETDGNKRDAAALLGISRSTLYRKLQNAGIDLENRAY